MKNFYILAVMTVLLATCFQLSDAGCHGGSGNNAVHNAVHNAGVSCTSHSDCPEHYACLSKRNGNGLICRLCMCENVDQCRVNSAKNVTCDCSGSSLTGKYCECDCANNFCVQGYTYFEGHCYIRRPEKRTWMAAKAQCNNQADFLVKIESSAENQFVQNLIFDSSETHWIGASDIDVEGVFKWSVDDTLLYYNNWNSGQPDSNSNLDNCVAMFYDSGKWNDDRCQRQYSFVCEYRVPNI